MKVVSVRCSTDTSILALIYLLDRCSSRTHTHTHTHTQTESCDLVKFSIGFATGNVSLGHRGASVAARGRGSIAAQFIAGATSGFGGRLRFTPAFCEGSLACHGFVQNVGGVRRCRSSD